MTLIRWLPCALAVLFSSLATAQVKNDGTIDADPVASVNGVPISHAVFMRGLLTVAGPRVLATLIESQVVEQEAKKRGLTVTEEELNARLQEEKEPLVAQRSLSADSYRRWLAAYKGRIALEMLREKFVEDQVTVTDAQIEEAYLRNKSVPPISQPERRRISMILVQDEKLAKSIRKQLEQSPQRFADLAREHSVSITAKDGGAMAGYFPRPKDANANPEEKAIFALAKPGDISDVIPSSAGYYIFRLDDIQPPATRTFAESKDAIREILRRQFMALKFRDWYAQAREAADVKVYLGPELVEGHAAGAAKTQPGK